MYEYMSCIIGSFVYSMYLLVHTHKIHGTFTFFSMARLHSIPSIEGTALSAARNAGRCYLAAFDLALSGHMSLHPCVRIQGRRAGFQSEP